MPQLDVRLLFLAGAILGVSGCVHKEDVMKPCPAPGILEDAEVVTTFDGKGQKEANVVNRVTISNIALRCEYRSNHNVANKKVRAGVDFDVSVALGPAGQPGPVTVPYFVAVTRAPQAILAREQYARTFDLRGKSVVRVREHIDQVDIPLAPKASGASYGVIVGLIETEAQLAYNRARHTQN